MGRRAGTRNGAAGAIDDGRRIDGGMQLASVPIIASSSPSCAAATGDLSVPRITAAMVVGEAVGQTQAGLS